MFHLDVPHRRIKVDHEEFDRVFFLSIKIVSVIISIGFVIGYLMLYEHFVSH